MGYLSINYVITIIEGDYALYFFYGGYAMLKIHKLNTEQEEPNFYKHNMWWRIAREVPSATEAQWRREWLGSFVGEQLAAPYSEAMMGRQVDMARVTLEELSMYDS